MRVDRQRVNVAAHQFSGGSIDHPMALDAGDPVEGRRRDGDVEMAAFARTRVAGVTGAVVTDFEQGGMKLPLQDGAQARHARRLVHEALSFPSAPRSIHSMRPMENTIATGGRIQTLKVTQSASDLFSATQMLATPSTM